MIYKFDSKQGKLQPAKEPWIHIKPGSGPRHFVFHLCGKYAYLINELNLTLITFAYDGDGKLRGLQMVEAILKDFKETNYCADIHAHHSGKFLYGSNRGHDSIVVYSIEESSGRLKYVCHEPSRGRTPRSFVVDPTGDFLLVANQDSDNIVVFRIDKKLVDSFQ
jgi:6-phosphogluconolactonase